MDSVSKEFICGIASDQASEHGDTSRHCGFYLHIDVMISIGKQPR